MSNTDGSSDVTKWISLVAVTLPVFLLHLLLPLMREKRKRKKRGLREAMLQMPGK